MENHPLGHTPNSQTQQGALGVLMPPRDLQAQGAETALGKILGTQSSLPSRQERSSELRGQGSRPGSAAHQWSLPCCTRISWFKRQAWGSLNLSVLGGS